MKKRLYTVQIHSTPYIRNFFNEAALRYREQHGDADKLLNYRLRLIRETGNISKNDTILEVGCGLAQHLVSLAASYKQAVGIDFSEKMIAIGQKSVESAGLQKKINLFVDNATRLRKIHDESIDFAFCVGTLEHIPDKAAVLKNIHRVLKKNGRFVLLTPNGGFLWYRQVAPLLKMHTKHLSSDHFPTETELKQLVGQTNFQIKSVSNWTFIPKGDMNSGMAIILQILDFLGKIFRIKVFRGGIIIFAQK